MLKKIGQWLKGKSGSSGRRGEYAESPTTYMTVLIILAASICGVSASASLANNKVVGADSMKMDKSPDKPEGKSTNLSGLESIQKAQSVKVLIDLPYSEHRIWNDESSLLELGCVFSSKRAEDVKGIAKIVLNSNVKIDPDLEPPVGIGEGIYFQFADGSVTKILLKSKRLGVAELRGILNSQNVVGDPIIVDGLYKWAIEVGGEKNCKSALIKYFNEH